MDPVLEILADGAAFAAGGEELAVVQLGDGEF